MHECMNAANTKHLKTWGQEGSFVTSMKSWLNPFPSLCSKINERDFTEKPSSC